MNGNNIVDNADGIVNVNDDFAVSGAATVNSLAVTTTSTFTGLATFNGGVTILGASNIGGTPVFTAASQFNAASTWGGPGAPTTMVNQGRVDIEANAGATAATAALEAENTFANGMAIHVPVGGGRTILSHGTGAGAVAIPGDVTVYEATGAGNPGLPAAATDGQILYIINTSGGNITPTGGTGTITLIPNNDARAYVYSGGWYEMP